MAMEYNPHLRHWCSGASVARRLPAAAFVHGKKRICALAKDSGVKSIDVPPTMCLYDVSCFNVVSTRRKFLFDCCALTAAAVASPAMVAAESTAPFWKGRSLHEIPCSALVRQVNTPFRIEAAPGRTIQVTLAEVRMRQEKPLKPGCRPPPDAGHEKFSLFFSGSRGDLLKQDVYSVAHETLGRFDLFLVPICTRNPAKIDYQVVVSRPRNQLNEENQTKG